jgi:DNA modification methylase
MDAKNTFASKIEHLSVNALRPYARNARTHSKAQISQIAASIERFGFTNPLLADDEGMILAGHGRLEAARRIGLERVPVLRLSHLSEAERRAYVLADNKLALNAGWDRDLLADELRGLIDLEFEVELTGFSTAEIDFTLGAAADASPRGPSDLDRVPMKTGPAQTRSGDLWALGRHRLLCGNARHSVDFDRLMEGDRAQMLFTDPPYNVPIQGHVQTRKSGVASAAQHREFGEASGEMSQEAFTAFLSQTLGNAADHCADGAIAFVCMDWRHMGELLEAGGAAFDELKNLVVWNKTNAGMGTFYRSKHELIFVFKKGTAPHINTFGLGDTGRYRTNVWDHPGMSSVGKLRDDALAMHPTVKPVAIITDALKDCSHRSHRVLDPFGGSGSTLIAAEACGRIAHLLELDPLYCDTSIIRWQQLTGQKAVLLAEREDHRHDGEQDEPNVPSRISQTFEALSA